MASILILSKHGDGVPIALRLARERHIVKMYIKEAKAKSSLEGYKNPSKISDPRRMLEQYDLILADMVGLGELCDELSSKGKLVLGGGTFNDKIELDREYGEKVIKSLTKAKLPKSKLIRTSRQLITYLQEASDPQAIKPLGNKPPGQTLVSNDSKNRTLIDIVTKSGEYLVPCIVQEVIEGIEISTEGWFSGEEWVRPFNHTIEQKRFMNGDAGPNTGCMGNVVWPTTGDKLTAEVLESLQPLLQRVKYIGPLDVNCIVTADSAYFLEFTARFGYEAIQTLTELLRGALFDFLYNVASAQTKETTIINEKAIGVRLSVSPYPNEVRSDQWKGVRVVDIPKGAENHVWLSDVMKNNDLPVLAGVDGVIGCVTARGGTVRECQRRAYRTIKNILLHPDVQYRQDIGEGVEEKCKQLTSWGWLQ